MIASLQRQLLAERRENRQLREELRAAANIQEMEASQVREEATQQGFSLPRGRTPVKKRTWRWLEHQKKNKWHEEREELLGEWGAEREELMSKIEYLNRDNGILLANMRSVSAAFSTVLHKEVERKRKAEAAEREDERAKKKTRVESEENAAPPAVEGKETSLEEDYFGRDGINWDLTSEEEEEDSDLEDASFEDDEENQPVDDSIISCTDLVEEADNADLAEQIVTLTSERDDAIEQRDEAVEELDSVQGQLTTRTTERDNAVEELEAADANLHEAEASLQVSQEENEGLLDQVSDLEREINSLRDSEDVLEGHAVDLEEERDELRRKSEEQEEEVNALRSIAEKKSIIAELKEQLAEAEKKATDAANTLRKEKHELEAQLAAVENSRRNEDELKEQRAEAKAVADLVHIFHLLEAEKKATDAANTLRKEKQKLHDRLAAAKIKESTNCKRSLRGERTRQSNCGIS